MNYYRQNSENNYKEEIKNLNNKIDILYSSLDNIIEERNNLLMLFNTKNNENILNENININNNKFNLIFTGKSEIGNIYKYVFHIFIESEYNELNLKFIINNKDFTYDIFIDKYKYIKIEEKFTFSEIQNFKIYLKSDKPLTVMKYTSYEILINYHPASVLNNQEHIKQLIYKTNKLYEGFAENKKLIREYILTDIGKDFTYIIYG